MPLNLQRLNADAFCRGYCAEFALALHEYTRWPIAVFNEVVDEDGEEFDNLVHATCKAPNGKYADARGFRGEKEILGNLMGTKGVKVKRHVVEIVSEGDLEGMTNIEEAALEDARIFISKNLNLWGLGNKRKSSTTWYKTAQSEVLYHVTHTKNVAGIKSKGILPLQTTNWTKGTGERYGNGEIYCLDDLKDAIRWAAKMDWEFNKGMGTGKISIVSFKKEDNWEEDDNDPISQCGNNGAWLKRIMMVKPEDILDSFPVTIDLIKTLR